MTKIMVIRHAEKPNGEPGVMPDGTENAEALTAAGWKRAEALVGLFDPLDGRFAPHLSRPERLLASGSDSLRPRQTIAPLGEALQLPVDTTFLKGQEDRLVASAKSAARDVLIAWQHEAIPKIASLILGSSAGIPAPWPGHRFDLVWVFESESGDEWSFFQTPELVLPGDSPAPIE